MVFTGVVGQIKWSYYVAAAINGYTVTRDGRRYRLRGTVVLADAFKMAQRPLKFVTPLTWQGRPVQWTWPIEDIELRDGTVTATLGPPT